MRDELIVFPGSACLIPSLVQSLCWLAGFGGILLNKCRVIVEHGSALNRRVIVCRLRKPRLSGSALKLS